MSVCDPSSASVLGAVSMDWFVSVISAPSVWSRSSLVWGPYPLAAAYSQVMHPVPPCAPSVGAASRTQPCSVWCSASCRWRRAPARAVTSVGWPVDEPEVCRHAGCRSHAGSCRRAGCRGRAGGDVHADRCGTRADAERASAHAGRGGPRHRHAQRPGKDHPQRAGRADRCGPHLQRRGRVRGGQAVDRHGMPSTTRRPAPGVTGSRSTPGPSRAMARCSAPSTSACPRAPCRSTCAGCLPTPSRHTASSAPVVDWPRKPTRTHLHPRVAALSHGLPLEWPRNLSRHATGGTTRPLERRGAAVSRSWALTGRR